MEADETEHDRRDTHQQLDHGLEHALSERRGDLNRKDGGTNRDGKRNRRRKQRDRKRRDDERKRAGLRQSRRLVDIGEAPISPGKEPNGVDTVLDEGRDALLRHHDDQRKDKKRHERYTRARDALTDPLKVALGHVLCHTAPFENS